MRQRPTQVAGRCDWRQRCGCALIHGSPGVIADQKPFTTMGADHSWRIGAVG